MWSSRRFCRRPLTSLRAAAVGLCACLPFAASAAGIPLPSLPDLPDLPPVRYSGQLESTVRMDSPEGLEDSMQLINRLNLNLGTYI
ncbi:MAG: hypothetical protein PVF91_15390, partial [Chromatiales bacterium]